MLEVCLGAVTVSNVIRYTQRSDEQNAVLGSETALHYCVGTSAPSLRRVLPRKIDTFQLRRMCPGVLLRRALVIGAIVSYIARYGRQRRGWFLLRRQASGGLDGQQRSPWALAEPTQYCCEERSPASVPPVCTEYSSPNKFQHATHSSVFICVVRMPCAFRQKGREGEGGGREGLH